MNQIFEIDLPEITSCLFLRCWCDGRSRRNDGNVPRTNVLKVLQSTNLL